MRKYLIYKNKDHYIISRRKFQDIKQEITDFDYAGCFEVDANEICEIYIERTPYNEIMPLVDKFLRMEFLDESYVCINRNQLICEYKEE